MTNTDNAKIYFVLTARAKILKIPLVFSLLINFSIIEEIGISLFLKQNIYEFY